MSLPAFSLMLPLTIERLGKWCLVLSVISLTTSWDEYHYYYVTKDYEAKSKQNIWCLPSLFAALFPFHLPYSKAPHQCPSSEKDFTLISFVRLINYMDFRSYVSSSFDVLSQSISFFF